MPLRYIFNHREHIGAQLCNLMNLAEDIRIETVFAYACARGFAEVGCQSPCPYKTCHGFNGTMFARVNLPLPLVHLRE